MLLQLETNAAVELLDAVDVDRVDLGTVVGKESGKRATNNLTAVDNGDDTAVEAVSVGENSVVNSDIFHDLDQTQGCAGENALLGLCGVQETDVVVHVVDVLVVQALDILAHVNNLLKVLILRLRCQHMC